MKELLTDREKDVLELCRQVISTIPNQYYNWHGADSSTCPFCYSKVEYIWDQLSGIKHEENCAYLIAKDLSTGYDDK